MNTALTTTELITHIDGSETPAPGRWSAAPGHAWLILRARTGPLAVEASACGAAVSGAVDIDPVPEHCCISLAVDTRRLSTERPRLARALGDQVLRIDAVRTGRFARGGWDIAGSVSTDETSCAFDAWIDYRGVYCRRPDLAYAWLTTTFSVPARVLGIPSQRLGRHRDVTLNLDILAIADRTRTSTTG